MTSPDLHMSRFDNTTLIKELGDLCRAAQQKGATEADVRRALYAVVNQGYPDFGEDDLGQETKKGIV